MSEGGKGKTKRKGGADRTKSAAADQRKRNDFACCPNPLTKKSTHSLAPEQFPKEHMWQTKQK